MNIFLRSDCKTNQNVALGEFLAVQGLGLQSFTVEGPGSIAGQGTKISQATQPKNRKN